MVLKVVEQHIDWELKEDDNDQLTQITKHSFSV